MSVELPLLQFYENAYKTMEAELPLIEKMLQETTMRSVFGERLEDHLRATNRTIAFPIALSIRQIEPAGSQRIAEHTLVGQEGKQARVSGCEFNRLKSEKSGRDERSGAELRHSSAHAFVEGGTDMQWTMRRP